MRGREVAELLKREVHGELLAAGAPSTGVGLVVVAD
jgi:hypothetical protein